MIALSGFVSVNILANLYKIFTLFVSTFVVCNTEIRESMLFCCAKVGCIPEERTIKKIELYKTNLFLKRVKCIDLC